MPHCETTIFAEIDYVRGLWPMAGETLPVTIDTRVAHGGISLKSDRTLESSGDEVEGGHTLGSMFWPSFEARISN